MGSWISDWRVQKSKRHTTVSAITETQFVTLCAALVASFVWMIGMRSRGRLTRVLGVVVLLGAWIAFRLLSPSH